MEQGKDLFQVERPISCYGKLSGMLCTYYNYSKWDDWDMNITFVALGVYLASDWVYVKMCVHVHED